MVEVSHDTSGRRLSAKQATRRQRQCNFQLRRRPVGQGWPNHRTYTELSKCRCGCKVETAVKTKYLYFGSARKAARDTGTDVNGMSESYESDILDAKAPTI